jgi:hypothetical protein
MKWKAITGPKSSQWDAAEIGVCPPPSPFSYEALDDERFGLDKHNLSAQIAWQQVGPGTLTPCLRGQNHLNPPKSDEKPHIDAISLEASIRH